MLVGFHGNQVFCILECEMKNQLFCSRYLMIVLLQLWSSVQRIAITVVH